MYITLYNKELEELKSLKMFNDNYDTQMMHTRDFVEYTTKERSYGEIILNGNDPMYNIVKEIKYRMNSSESYRSYKDSLQKLIRISTIVENEHLRGLELDKDYIRHDILTTRIVENFNHDNELIESLMTDQSVIFNKLRLRSMKKHRRVMIRKYGLVDFIEWGEIDSNGLGISKRITGNTPIDDANEFMYNLIKKLNFIGVLTKKYEELINTHFESLFTHLS